jgi:DNA-binding response OmpR family regulator
VYAAAQGKGCRFVLLTTDGRWVAERATELGSLQIIEKPFDVDELVQAVRAALRKRRTRASGEDSGTRRETSGGQG